MKQVFGLLRAVRNKRAESTKSAPDQQKQPTSSSSAPNRSQTAKPAPAPAAPKQSAPKPGVPAASKQAAPDKTKQSAPKQAAPAAPKQAAPKAPPTRKKPQDPKSGQTPKPGALASDVKTPAKKTVAAENSTAIKISSSAGAPPAPGSAPSTTQKKTAPKQAPKSTSKTAPKAVAKPSQEAAKKPAPKPETKPATKPVANAAPKPAAKPATKAVAPKAEPKPTQKAAQQPAPKPTPPKAAQKPAAPSPKPEHKTLPKTGQKPAAKPAPKAVEKPAPKPETKPATKPVANAAPKPAAKPATKAVAPKAEPKPTQKAAQQPAPKPTPPKAAQKPAAPSPKPEHKTLPKTGQKPAAKLAPKAVEKPAPKPETKPATKPVANAAQKPATKPAPRPETKPAQKPAAKPEPKKVTPKAEQKAAPAPVAVQKRPRQNVPEALAIPPENKTVKQDRRARLRQVKGLDGLRGLAVLAVVIYHFFGDILPGGYLGVDLFFVLSGFLITSLLVREYRVSQTISLKDFWIRRFRRILPAALVTLFIVTALVTAIGGDIAVGIREQFLGTLFFVNNWTQIATSQSYFAENEVQVFAHYWSLAVEEQFYIIWPLLTLAMFTFTQRRLHRAPRRVPMLVTVLLAVASVLGMWLLFTPGEDPTRVYYGTDTHAFGLLIGAFFSLLVTSTQNDPRVDSWASVGKFEARVAGAIGFLAFIGYAAQLLFMGDDLAFTYRGGLALTSVLGVLMIWGVIRETGPLTLIFRTKVMRWLGQRSFSLYLWHWPVIMILRELFNEDGRMQHEWILGLVALPIALLISEISYQHVENPFRRRGYKQTWKNYVNARPSYHEINEGFKKVAWPFVPLLVVASVGGVIYGVVNSNDKTELEQQLDQLQQMNQSANNNKKAAPAPAAPSPKPDQKSAPVQGKDITAVGDSVMLAASQALNADYPGIFIDADVSRHYTAGVEVLRQLKDSGQLRSTVFLGFGTNGAAFPDQMEEMINLIGPDHTIVMATPYGDREWMGQARQEVIEAAKTHDNVYMADWCGHAQAHPDLLFEDGVHPMPEGAEEYSKAFGEALEQSSAHKKKTTSSCA